MLMDEARDGEGRRVRYRRTGETGVITGFNLAYAFVRYGEEHGSKATRPEDLEFVDTP